jgi:mannitol-1-phosphate/altronate dehydrogenases
LKLTSQGLNKQWSDKGYKLPKFNQQEIKKNTKETPEWIHFGAGNIFRAFQANVVQELLDKKALTTGLIVAEGYDYEIISKMYTPHDNLGILATLKADGSIEKTVVASIIYALQLDSQNDTEYESLKEIFRKPSLKMASFTITEKGYSLVDGKGDLLKDVALDFTLGVDRPKSYIGKVTALLYERYKNNALPIAMVSMDNCSHNGDKLYAAVTAFAKEWSKEKLVEDGFLQYLEDTKKVTFPWTMIDKITPRPDKKVKKILEDDGIEDLEQVITSKNTYIAPFVNAEECQYLVIEDKFPNGRIPLEKAGIIYTDRETVDKVEKMKVCTCLNPLHTSLAIFGCLLGYDLISKEMQDADLRHLVERVGYKEGLPVVVDPKVLEPKKFIDEVVNVRIPNPFMPDTPQRIASDTSQKLSIRFGNTIKAYIKAGKDIRELKGIALVLAGWLRYLMKIDDEGNAFELSPDPLLDVVCPYVDDIKLGEDIYVHEKISPLLENVSIFGVYMYKIGLGEIVEENFKKLISGKGAVRKALKELREQD